MAWKNISLRIRLGLVVLGLFGGVTLAQPLLVSAGPITNGPGVAPFTKLGIYQGLLTVAPVPVCVGGTNPGASCPNSTECTGGGICTAASIMEIGNAGRDIAGTGEIYIRPGSTDRSVALRFFKEANGRSDLFLSSGSLCLGSVSGTTCRSTWPSGGGAGDTYWEEYSVSPKLCVGGRFAGIGCYDSTDCSGGGICTTQSAQTVLRPSAAATPSTIRIGRPNTPVPSTSGRTVEVYGNGSTVAKIGGWLSTGLSSYDGITGVTSFTGGDVSITGNLFVRNVTLASGAYENGEPDAYVYNSIDKYSNYYPTYRERGQEGPIDADTFDSDTVLPFASYYCRKGTNPGASCVNGTMNGPNPAACLGGGVCQKNDLQVVTVDILNSSSVFGHICIKTNNSKLCAGGTAASNAGAPCTSDAQCTNGAICTSMCQSTLEVCPLDPRPTANDPVGGFRCFGGANHGQGCTTLGYGTAQCPNCGGAGQPACPAAARTCSNNGNVCTDNAQCGTGSCIYNQAGECSAYRCENTNKPCHDATDCGGSGGACLRGKAYTQTTGSPSSLSCGSVDCQSLCRTTGKIACSGNVPSDPICGSYGTSAFYTNGHPARADIWLGGSCFPDCSLGCGPNPPLTYIQMCDCFVDTPTEFYQAQPPGNGGLLCTDNFY